MFPEEMITLLTAAWVCLMLVGAVLCYRRPEISGMWSCLLGAVFAVLVLLLPRP